MAWLDGVELSGRQLATTGLQPPLLPVDASVLIRITAAD